MAFGLVGALVEAMMFGPEGMDYASVSFAGIDPSTWKVTFPEHTLQYWPESLSDTMDIGWNFKDIAGASSALGQWGSNNGRTFTFEVQFHRFMKPVEDRSAFDTILDPIKLNKPNTPLLKDNRPYNVDIANEIRHLRAFCYPTYTKDQTNALILNSSPPPIMILNFPKMQLNETGDDFIFGVMTGCDVNYLLTFPNGVPRRATVSLTVRQVVQLKKGVMFAGHGDALTKFTFKQEIDMAGGGARSKNKLVNKSKSQSGI